MVVQYGHPRSERGEHRGEFQSDIAAADDDEIIRQFFPLHDGRAGIDVPALSDTFDGRNDRTRTGIDENVFGGQFQCPAVGQCDRDGIGRDETSFPVVYGDVRIIRQVMVVPVSQHGGERVFLFDGFPVMAFFGVFVAVGQAGGFTGLMDQCFGGDAADIDTCSAVHSVVSFDHRDFPAPFGEIGRQRFSALAESDDDSVDFFHVVFLFTFLMSGKRKPVESFTRVFPAIGKPDESSMACFSWHRFYPDHETCRSGKFHDVDSGEFPFRCVRSRYRFRAGDFCEKRNVGSDCRKSSVNFFCIRHEADCC